MLHSSKARVSSPKRAAEEVRLQLARLGRPSESFDAGRYFRAHRDDWSIGEAVEFAVERYGPRKRRELLAITYGR